MSHSPQSKRTFAGMAGRLLITCLLSVGGGLFLISHTLTISVGDLLLIAVASSVITAILASFLRDPQQFCLALSERTKYAVLVVMNSCVICVLFAVRILTVIAKISIRLLIALLGSVIYVLFPLDIIPDFIFTLGQIDELIVFFGLFLWAFNIGVTKHLQTSMRVNKPIARFP